MGLREFPRFFSPLLSSFPGSRPRPFLRSFCAWKSRCADDDDVSFGLRCEQGRAGLCRSPLADARELVLGAARAREDVEPLCDEGAVVGGVDWEACQEVRPPPPLPIVELWEVSADEGLESSRYVNVGLFYLRQLFFANFDLKVHTDQGTQRALALV